MLGWSGDVRPIRVDLLTLSTVNDGLIDGFRHNAWATRGLIDFCRRLNDDQLSAKAVGSYGSILETLKHLIGAECFYTSLLTGRFPDWEWDEAAPADLDQLAGWAADLEAIWEDLLSRPIDAESLLHEDFGNEGYRDARAGIVLAQALHHGTAHREQVATILTSLRFEPPDLDVWAYGESVGRDTFTSPGTAPA